ncbi:aminopeptidase, putative [Pedobacter sp. BAL39]|uniref:M1 family metallopeptidase n=1 Tax=Pedobacter sp. BAL39 TaxID=391596 RepID=UPI0001559278|nr:M1 family metallopeptidase [Pedobacter sp. BAL39]EDM38801.1 aminopeptidase, putative [Pedobacter sp. BAL39]
MKKYLLTLLFIGFYSLTFAQEQYWQQSVSYDIDVALNDKTNTLKGAEKVVYKNNSPTTLDFIWFHIWPNAYKQESTALFQQLKNDTARVKKLEKYTFGSIDGLNFKVNGVKAQTEAHSNPQYIDIIKVKLNTPLKPGESVTITTDFNVKLPSYFSRSGFADGEFMVCQWYPKPAVFDKSGWHEFPYLDMGEFYADYADFKVNITLPSDYIVGATGTLQNTDELAAYKSLGAKNVKNRTGKPSLYTPKKGKATKTLSYVMNNVPDFAWFADKNFVIQYDTAKLASKTVDVFTYYHNKEKSLWVNSVDYAKDAVKRYSGWIGEYEYPVVQVVEGPANNASGGMEYPTITLITSPDASVERLDGVITHEVGHNWFMSMLGSNERMHTWLDEGLNSYFQFRYEAEKYKSNSIFGDAIPENIRALPVQQFQNALYNAMLNIPMQSPIETPAADFASSDEYGLISYVKAALWLHILESEVGREKMDKAFQDYFSKWKNKHPQPEDLKAAFEASLGLNLDGYFNLLNKQGGFAE